MLTRTIADLTFEVYAPHQYRLVHTDPDYADHDVWMLFDGEDWYLSVFIDVGPPQFYRRHDRMFKSRNEIVSLLTSRRMAV